MVARAFDTLSHPRAVERCYAPDHAFRGRTFQPYMRTPHFTEAERRGTGELLRYPCRVAAAVRVSLFSSRCARYTETVWKSRQPPECFDCPGESLIDLGMHDVPSRALHANTLSKTIQG